MEFLWPLMLSFLALIPILVLFYLRIQHRRQIAARRFSNLLFVKQALRRGPGARRHIPAICYIFCVTFAVVGLARPAVEVEIPSFEGTVILALDTSGSMAADDIAPNRMQAAQAAARVFVEHQPPTVKIGVVSFSDQSFLIQAPTSDPSDLLAAIDRLSPQQGTAIGLGLETSFEAIFETQHIGYLALHDTDWLARPWATPTPMPRAAPLSGVIVLLTDGVNNQLPNPLTVAGQLADRNIRVYTIGLGNPQGSEIRVQGESIHVGLDEPMLKEIARITGGVYSNAVSDVDLQEVFGNLRRQLVFRIEKEELTAPLTGAAILFALLGGTLSLFWFNRLP